MKTVLINNTEYQLISSFAEMSKYQFLNLCKLRLEHIEKEATQIEYNALRIVAFNLLSNVPLYLINRITSDQWVDLLPYVDYAFLEVPDLKKNLLPEIKIGKEILHGPVGLMDKCTIDEFTRIDTSFISASNGKDIASLSVMFSYMYRPIRKDLKSFKKSSSWNGDIREEFNAEKCKSRLNKIKEFPMIYLVANYLYFSSVREQRFKILKYLFAEVESKIRMDDRGWAGSMLQLSHSGVFGNFEQQMKQNWFTVMVEMDRLSEQTIKQNQNK